MNSSKIFHLDINYYKKQIILKYFILSCLNIGFLIWAILKSEKQDLSIYLISLGIIIIMFVLFRRNGIRQIELLKKNIYEFDKNILKHYANTSSCMELDLNDVKVVYIDKIFGKKRILLKFSKDRIYTYSNIINLEEFQKNLEDITNHKAIPLERNFYELGFKAFFIFLPSMVTFILTYFPKLHINLPIFFLIVNLNLIFFIQQISEEKVLGGIPKQISRRIIFILVAFFFFQFYRVFFMENLY